MKVSPDAMRSASLATIEDNGVRMKIDEVFHKEKMRPKSDMNTSLGHHVLAISKSPFW